MQRAETVIAASLMGLSIYFMWHATVLPIGWVEGEGPGGGAFPFWLSALMLAASGAIFVRSLATGVRDTSTFFDMATIRSVVAVCIALILTVALTPFLGAYVTLPAFTFWYLRIFGRQGWMISIILTTAVPVFVFFFFEVTLKILLPKGITEPYFFPLYAAFF